MRFAAILSFGAVASALPTISWNKESPSMASTNSNIGNAKMDIAQNQADSEDGKPAGLKLCPGGRIWPNGYIGGCGYSKSESSNNAPVMERTVTWPKEGDDEDYDKRDHIYGSSANDVGFKSVNEGVITE